MNRNYYNQPNRYRRFLTEAEEEVQVINLDVIEKKLGRVVPYIQRAFNLMKTRSAQHAELLFAYLLYLVMKETKITDQSLAVLLKAARGSDKAFMDLLKDEGLLTPEQPTTPTPESEMNQNQMEESRYRYGSRLSENRRPNYPKRMYPRY